ncbi:MAG TPA: hypothetical protein VGM09_14990, partial [Bradyrhizobium sp.]
MSCLGRDKSARHISTMTRGLAESRKTVAEGFMRCGADAGRYLMTVLTQLRKCLILHCSKNEKLALLKGRWHFQRHVCIGAAIKVWGLRRGAPGNENAGGNMRRLILAAASVAALALIGQA